MKNLSPGRAIAKNLADCKHRFGWVTRLFMGHASPENICAELNETEAQRNHAKWQRQLLATGQPAHAIIRQLRDTGAVVNFKPVIAFELDVHADGHPAWRVTVTTPIERVALPQLNDVIEVRYNPENQHEVALVD